jgi:hypothetical protein
MDSSWPENLLARIRRATRLDELPLFMRRTIVGVIGGTILLIGIALIFLPGPAILVIPFGLAILATEFAWARHTLLKARQMLKRGKNKKNVTAQEKG